MSGINFLTIIVMKLDIFKITLNGFKKLFLLFHIFNLKAYISASPGPCDPCLNPALFVPVIVILEKQVKFD